MREKRPRLFDILKQGLEEGIAFERGERKLRVTELIINEPPGYTGSQVQAVRTRLRLSQASFAHVLAVSVKTVQAWEQGRQTPSPQAARLLQVVEHQPEAFLQMVLHRSVPVSAANPRAGSQH